MYLKRLWDWTASNWAYFISLLNQQLLWRPCLENLCVFLLLVQHPAKAFRDLGRLSHRIYSFTELVPSRARWRDLVSILPNKIMISHSRHGLNFFKKKAYESSVRCWFSETVSIFLNSVHRPTCVSYYRGDVMQCHDPVEWDHDHERCVHYMTNVLGLEM